MTDRFRTELLRRTQDMSIAEMARALQTSTVSAWRIRHKKRGVGRAIMLKAIRRWPDLSYLLVAAESPMDAA